MVSTATNIGLVVSSGTGTSIDPIVQGALESLPHDTFLWGTRDAPVFRTPVGEYDGSKIIIDVEKGYNRDAEDGTALFGVRLPPEALPERYTNDVTAFQHGVFHYEIRHKGTPFYREMR